MIIYLVDYWVPFPSSEYGGLQCVIARDADHCAEILVGNADEYDRKAHPDYEKLIQNSVARAKLFHLDSNRDYKAGLVESFIT